MTAPSTEPTSALARQSPPASGEVERAAARRVFEVGFRWAMAMHGRPEVADYDMEIAWEMHGEEASAALTLVTSHADGQP